MSNLKIFLIVCFVIPLVGCQESISNDQAAFPKEVSGVWDTDKGQLSWIITITEDGKVESVRMPLGGIIVHPNQESQMTMQDGSISTVTAGDIECVYNSLNRELIIEIVIEDIDIHYLDSEIKGNSEYFFAGPVSKDGMVWDADITEIFDYGPLLQQGIENIESISMPFKKVVNK